jgi:sugar lactone lactonase YvrE
MTLLLLSTLAAMAGVPKASSELKNDKGKMPVDLAFDGLLSTAWAEADKGPGEGQWVEIDLGKVMDLRGVSVWAGDLSEGERSFKESSRPKVLHIEVDGKPMGDPARVRDEINRVDVKLSGTGRKIRVVFDEVYTGYVYNDLYVAEIAVNFPENDPDQTKRLDAWVESKDAAKKAEAFKAQLDASFDICQKAEGDTKDAFRFIERAVSDGPAFVHEQIMKTVPAGFRAQAVRSSGRARKALRLLKDANGIPALRMAALRATGEDAAELEGHVEALEAYNELIGGRNRTNVRYWGESGFVPGALRSFGEPMGIEIDRNGRVLVADIGNNRIQAFSDEGRPERQWGLAMDITNVWFQGTRKWYASGANGSEEPGGWTNPLDVTLIPGKEADGFAAIDALGRIQIVDAGGNTKIGWKVETKRKPEPGVGGEAYLSYLPKKKALLAVMRDEGIIYNLESEELGRFKFSGGVPNAVEIGKKGQIFVAEGREVVLYNHDGFRHGAVIFYQDLNEGFEDMDISLDELGRIWVLTDTGHVHVFAKPGKKEFSMKVIDRPLKHPRFAVRQDVVYIVSDDEIERIDVAQMRLDEAAKAAEAGK